MHHQLLVDLVIITYLLWILWIGFSPTGWGHCRHPPLLPPESSFFGVPPTVFSAGHSWTSLTGYLSHTCGRQCSQGWVAGQVQYLLWSRWALNTFLSHFVVSRMYCGKLLRTRGPFTVQVALRMFCILVGAVVEILGILHSLPLRACHVAVMALLSEPSFGTVPSRIFQMYMAI